MFNSLKANLMEKATAELKKMAVGGKTQDEQSSQAQSQSQPQQYYPPPQSQQYAPPPSQQQYQAPSQQQYQAPSQQQYQAPSQQYQAPSQQQYQAPSQQYQAPSQQYQAPSQQYQAGSAPGATHRALFIGINYFGSKAELHGCINDVNNVLAYVRTAHPHFREILVLTDEQRDPSMRPTRANIINAFEWLVAGAKPGDSFFLHYSGHGGSVPDTSGDEADGLDETIIPMDYEIAGQIIDDEMHARLLARLPEGSKFTAVFDSCHSGSVLDLDIVYTVNGNQELQMRDHRQEAISNATNAVKAYIGGRKGEAMSDAKSAFQSFFEMQKEQRSGVPKPPPAARNPTRALVVQFAGCHDDQTSADATILGHPSGAMSWALLQVLRNPRPVTYLDILRETRGLLLGKYKQVPQLSSGREMDVNAVFSL